MLQRFGVVVSCIICWHAVICTLVPEHMRTKMRSGGESIIIIIIVIVCSNIFL